MVQTSHCSVGTLQIVYINAKRNNVSIQIHTIFIFLNNSNNFNYPVILSSCIACVKYVAGKNNS